MKKYSCNICGQFLDCIFSLLFIRYVSYFFKKLFLDLRGGTLQPSIPHSARADDQLFLTFDFTHNFKNIFNNFIGKERFHLPAVDFSELFGDSCIAKFGHIKHFLEECKTLKVAFALKKKCH